MSQMVEQRLVDYYRYVLRRDRPGMSEGLIERTAHTYARRELREYDPDNDEQRLLTQARRTEDGWSGGGR